jgi:hypothetical protein
MRCWMHGHMVRDTLAPWHILHKDSEQYGYEAGYHCSL